MAQQGTRGARRPQPVVVDATERPFVRTGDGLVSARTAIDRASTGCLNLEQWVIRHEPGGSRIVHHADSDEVAYVTEGQGTAMIADRELPLRPGTGLLVPAGTACEIANMVQEPLVLLSVVSPQPGASSAPPAAAVPADPSFTVHASDQPTIPAGDDERRGLMDRHFKVLIDPARGARYVTQFIGVIERSRAPFHTHTYEEVIYILGGRGIVHLADGQREVGAGTSIYLPVGAEHCLENAEDEPLTLVGVFCPAGSPAARRPATTAAG